MSAEAAAQEASDLAERWNDLLFGVRRSIRYHTRRRMFFERWARYSQFAGVLFGSATVATVLGDIGPDWLPAATAAIVALVSAADLVLGFSTKARDYHDLARRFADIEKGMVTEDK